MRWLGSALFDAIATLAPALVFSAILFGSGLASLNLP